MIASGRYGHRVDHPDGTFTMVPSPQETGLRHQIEVTPAGLVIRNERGDVLAGWAPGSWSHFKVFFRDREPKGE